MYRIIWADGGREQRADTLDEAEALVRRAYPEAAIGHSGDLRDGGDRTLAWEDEEHADDDDGRRSVATIRRERRDP